MSEQNLEIVRRAMEALNERDFAWLKELCDPEIEVDLSRNVFNPNVHRGYEGLERVQSGIEEVWADLQGEPVEIIEVGDKVVTAITLKGTGKESGVDVAMEIFQVWEFRDSKLYRVIGGIRDRAEAIDIARDS